jgi:large subunit ribosomal protein L23
MAEKKVNTEKKLVATAGVYDILVRPVVSEKSAKLSESNGVVFEVAPNATKSDVARAMQVIYGVKPTKVNIVITKGKVKTFRGRSTGKQRDIKKAYVSLPADATVDLSVDAQSK